MKVKILTTILFLLLVTIFSASSEDEEYRYSENLMIKNTPLESLPEGLWVQNPKGKIRFNNEFFGTEFNFELGKSVECLGLFSWNLGLKNTYEVYSSGDKDLALLPCSYSVTFDSTTDWKPYSIVVENLDSPATLFFLIEGINLRPDKNIKTWFTGIDPLFESKGRFTHEFQSLSYITDYGELLIYPDTTKIVHYEKSLSRNRILKENIAPYYVTFGNKTSLIKRDIYYGNEGNPQVIWVGDLDNDKIPDLLLDIATHYAGGHYLLLLSTLAEDGELYGLAARLHTVSC